MVTTRQQEQQSKQASIKKHKKYYWKGLKHIHKIEQERYNQQVRSNIVSQHRLNVLNERQNQCNAQLSAFVDLQHFNRSCLPETFRLPPMSAKCLKCRASLFPNELQHTKICCLNGKVALLPLEKIPEELKELFDGHTSLSKSFRTDIRAYNCAFSCVSLGANIDKKLATNRNGIYTFRLQGQMHHIVGPLLPTEENENPSYAQIFFQDPDYDQVNRRYELFPNLNVDILHIIQDIMERYNPFVHSFQHAREIWNQNTVVDLFLKLTDCEGFDRRRYNTPTEDSIAVIMGSHNNTHTRDIILQTRQDTLERITELNSNYDCLAYPLFGNSLGFQIGINHRIGNGTVSIREFYAYRLHHREGEDNIILHGGKLFHQYVVDQFAKYEQSNIRYIQMHQKQIRAGVYQGFEDQAMNDKSPQDVGKRIILPSSFTGGPRYLNQLFQDSLSITAALGRPSVFITITCNPHWPEIVEQLSPNETPNDRPDIIARVFNQKFNLILEELTKKGILGECTAHMYTIEFQKRGLPHAHVILIFAPGHKCNSANDINHIVSAELPDENEQPELYSQVVKHNMHGPCGLSNPNSPCMRNRTCTKYYPKDFNESTYVKADSYPVYQRTNNGRQVFKKGIQLDNRSVVPYNPYLTAKYQCHINVEACEALDSIKYVYSYIYKGDDRAFVEISTLDECKQYLDSRYVSAPEAIWRLYGFKMHGRSHTVYRLPFHLPGQQYATFEENTSIESIRRENAKTMLTEFFQLCSTNDDAKQYSYNEIPLYDFKRMDKTTKNKIGNSTFVCMQSFSRRTILSSSSSQYS
jgi:hypothetical protein